MVPHLVGCPSIILGIGSSSHVVLGAVPTVFYDFLFLYSLEVAECNIHVFNAQFGGFSDPLTDQITIFINDVTWYMMIKLHGADTLCY